MEVLGHKEADLEGAVREFLPKIRATISGVCTYGYVEEVEGKLVSGVDDNHACLAGMSGYYHYHKARKPILVVYDLSTSRLKTSITTERLAWVKWVCEESPWRHCFVMLDKFNPELNGVLVSRTDISSNYLATANNILRIGIENSSKLDSWYNMVKHGVSPNLAFCMCAYNTTMEGGDVVFGNLYEYWSHSILYNTTHLKGMLDLMAGKILPNEGYLDEPFYTNKTYNGALDYLRELGGDTSLSLVSKFCKTKSKTVSKGEDLMGRSLGQVTGVFVTPEQLNEFWRDYVSTD